MDKKSYNIIIDYVKDKIISSELKLGDKLPSERYLSETLSISRNSIREGLRLLNNIGAVETIQGSGNYIVNNFQTTLKDIMLLMNFLKIINMKELMEFRYALEIRAFLLALKNIEPCHIFQLNEYIEILESSSSEAELILYDKKIHYLILEISKNRYIYDNILAFDILIEEYLKFLYKKVFFEKENRKELLEIHKGIVLSIQDKNIAKGMEFLDKHFNYILSSLE